MEVFQVKKYIAFMSLVLMMLLCMSACSNNGGSANSSNGKVTKSEQETKQTDQESKNDGSEESTVSKFVLENTKIVKVINISKREDKNSPEQGPFFIVRGIDSKGQKSEVWIRDMKIHEINATD